MDFSIKNAVAGFLFLTSIAVTKVGFAQTNPAPANPTSVVQPKTPKQIAKEKKQFEKEHFSVIGDTSKIWIDNSVLQPMGLEKVSKDVKASVDPTTKEIILLKRDKLETGLLRMTEVRLDPTGQQTNQYSYAYTTDDAQTMAIVFTSNPAKGEHTYRAYNSLTNEEMPPTNIESSKKLPQMDEKTFQERYKDKGSTLYEQYGVTTAKFPTYVTSEITSAEKAATKARLEAPTLAVKKANAYVGSMLDKNDSCALGFLSQLYPKRVDNFTTADQLAVAAVQQNVAAYGKDLEHIIGTDPESASNYVIIRNNKVEQITKFDGKNYYAVGKDYRSRMIVPHTISVRDADNNIIINMLKFKEVPDNQLPAVPKKAPQLAAPPVLAAQNPLPAPVNKTVTKQTPVKTNPVVAKAPKPPKPPKPIVPVKSNNTAITTFSNGMTTIYMIDASQVDVTLSAAKPDPKKDLLVTNGPLYGKDKKNSPVGAYITTTGKKQFTAPSVGGGNFATNNYTLGFRPNGDCFMLPYQQGMNIDTVNATFAFQNGLGLIKDGKELTTKGSTGAKTRQAFGYNMTTNQYIIVDSQEPREVHDLTVLMKQSGADYAIYTDGGNVNGVAENVNGKKMVTTSTLPDKAMKLHFVPK